MKDSLIPTGGRGAILRLTRLVLPTILTAGLATGCGPQTAPGTPSGPGPHANSGPQASPWPGAQGPGAQRPGAQGPQAAPASASNSQLVGQWRTVIPAHAVDGVQVAAATITITISASGQYDQTGQAQQAGGTQTMQAGPYQLIPPNTIHFTVTTYSPMTRWMFVPNPRCGIPGVPTPTNPKRDSCYQEQEESLPQPPGSTYAYSFNGANTMILNNENAQETINFTRVTQ